MLFVRKKYNKHLRQSVNQEEVLSNTVSFAHRYIIPALQRADAGFYQCIVRNRMGALLQKRSQVQVACMSEWGSLCAH